MQVRDQPQQLSKTLSNLVRPCFKKPKSKGWGEGYSLEVECLWVQPPVSHTHTHTRTHKEKIKEKKEEQKEKEEEERQTEGSQV